MNLKALFLVFLCVLSVSIICDAALSTANAAKGKSEESIPAGSICYLTGNGTESDGDGDPIGGDWPR